MHRLKCVMALKFSWFNLILLENKIWPGVVFGLTSKPSGSGTQQEILARFKLESLISWERRCKESPYCYVKNLQKLIVGNQGELHSQKFARYSGMVWHAWVVGSIGPAPSTPKRLGGEAAPGRPTTTPPEGNNGLCTFVNTAGLNVHLANRTGCFLN